MNRGRIIRSILIAGALFLAAGCGEAPRTGPEAELRATPGTAEETLSRYRERGIEPRKARFSREWEE